MPLCKLSSSFYKWFANSWTCKIAWFLHFATMQCLMYIMRELVPRGRFSNNKVKLGASALKIWNVSCYVDFVKDAYTNLLEIYQPKFFHRRIKNSIQLSFVKYYSNSMIEIVPKLLWIDTIVRLKSYAWVPF